MAPTPPLSERRARAFVAALDLDLDASGVCYACLSFVSLALDTGDAARITREVRLMTPDLWEDGLAETALATVRGAVERGVPDADASLADLEQRGARSVVAREIVRRLAADLSCRIRTERRVRTVARERLRSAAPELN